MVCVCVCVWVVWIFKREVGRGRFSLLVREREVSLVCGELGPGIGDSDGKLCVCLHSECPMIFISMLRGY
jgi:hypothetical protein